MNLKIYNSLSGEKENFKPIHENNVGMYVCGPTVYSNVHLGNVRTFMSFDFIYRTLLFLGYKAVSYTHLDVYKRQQTAIPWQMRMF